MTSDEAASDDAASACAASDDAASDNVASGPLVFRSTILQERFTSGALFLQEDRKSTRLGVLKLPAHQRVVVEA